MAPLFSAEWCAAAAQAFNRDPEAADATAGWVGDVGLVAEPVGVLLRAVDGQVLIERMPAEALDARGPASSARASLETWAGLIDGRIDPIAAVVQGQLVLRGDVQQVVARLRYKGLAERWLTAVRGGI